MRPRDPVTNKLMDPPCKRYDCTPFYAAALPAICADPRSPALPMVRKLQLVERAMNTVIDGDKPPGWVMKKDWKRQDNTFLQDVWAVAVERCQGVLGRVS